MTSRRAHFWTAAVLSVALITLTAGAQTPILEFSLPNPELEITQSGSATLAMQVENTSIQEADELEISMREGALSLRPVEPVEVIEPFETLLLALTFSANESVEVGSQPVVLEIAYTYCIGDLCYQIVEPLDVEAHVLEAPTEPADGTEPSIVPDGPVFSTPRWARIVPPVLALLLVSGLVLAQWRSRRRLAMALLALCLAGSLALGFREHQDRQAQSIGAVLCTSCVGIEEEPRTAFSFSDEARERIEAIDQEIELVFFTATWCQACPYAKEAVREAVALNPNLSYHEVDVGENRAEAEAAGVIRSERTIVPAILRPETGEVLFGIEDLEERLLELLEGEP